MVNGVNGVGAGMSAEELKAFVQNLIEETLETKGVGSQPVAEESVDEESGVVSEETPTVETTEPTEVENPLTGFLTSITSLFGKMMDLLTQVLGVAQGGAAQSGETADGTQQSAQENSKYVMTEDEKAYLTLHPDYVRDLVAQEKYQEKYGDQNSFWNKIFGESRMNRIAQSVTDEEIQAYLQLHPNVIKDAIASGK